MHGNRLTDATIERASDQSETSNLPQLREFGEQPHKADKAGRQAQQKEQEEEGSRLSVQAAQYCLEAVRVGDVRAMHNVQRQVGALPAGDPQYKAFVQTLQVISQNFAQFMTWHDIAPASEGIRVGALLAVLLCVRDQSAAGIILQLPSLFPALGKALQGLFPEGDGSGKAGGETGLAGIAPQQAPAMWVVFSIVDGLKMLCRWADGKQLRRLLLSRKGPVHAMSGLLTLPSTRHAHNLAAQVSEQRCKQESMQRSKQSRGGAQNSGKDGPLPRVTILSLQAYVTVILCLYAEKLPQLDAPEKDEEALRFFLLAPSQPALSSSSSSSPPRASADLPSLAASPFGRVCNLLLAHCSEVAHGGLDPRDVSSPHSPLNMLLVAALHLATMMHTQLQAMPMRARAQLLQVLHGTHLPSISAPTEHVAAEELVGLDQCCGLLLGKGGPEACQAEMLCKQVQTRAKALLRVISSPTAVVADPAATPAGSTTTVAQSCARPGCAPRAAAAVDSKGAAEGGGTVRLMVCGACKEAKYCSVDCQRRHRKQHKITCQAVCDAKSKASLNAKSNRADRRLKKQDKSSHAAEGEQICNNVNGGNVSISQNSSTAETLAATAVEKRSMQGETDVFAASDEPSEVRAELSRQMSDLPDGELVGRAVVVVLLAWLVLWWASVA